MVICEKDFSDLFCILASLSVKDKAKMFSKPQVGKFLPFNKTVGFSKAERFQFLSKFSSIVADEVVQNVLADLEDREPDDQHLVDYCASPLAKSVVADDEFLTPAADNPFCTPHSAK